MSMIGAGMLVAIGLWVLLYGGNLFWRWFVERRHMARYQVLATYRVRMEPNPETEQKQPSMWALAVCAGILLGDPNFVIGAVLASVPEKGLRWLFKRSKTRSTETVMFDREGLALFPPRRTMLQQGIFKARIDWKNVQGYSAYRGSVLFSLRPLGHIEQHYGTYRQEFEAVLERLNVPKLVAFDVVEEAEAGQGVLDELEKQVLLIAQDVVSGYHTDAVAAGVRMVPKVLYSSEADDGQIVGGNAYLHIGLWEGETCLREMEWLIWERSEDLMELLALPKERLYETLDERLEGILEERMAQVGVETQPSVLQ